MSMVHWVWSSSLWVLYNYSFLAGCIGSLNCFMVKSHVAKFIWKHTNRHTPCTSIYTPVFLMLILHLRGKGPLGPEAPCKSTLTTPCHLYGTPVKSNLRDYWSTEWIIQEEQMNRYSAFESNHLKMYSCHTIYFLSHIGFVFLLGFWSVIKKDCTNKM